MTTERAKEIAQKHVNMPAGSATVVSLRGWTLFIETVFEPGYFDGENDVTYIDIVRHNNTCMETHTSYPGDVDSIAFWIMEMCYDKEEEKQ